MACARREKMNKKKINLKWPITTPARLFFDWSVNCLVWDISGYFGWVNLISPNKQTNKKSTSINLSIVKLADYDELLESGYLLYKYSNSIKIASQSRFKSSISDWYSHFFHIQVSYLLEKFMFFFKTKLVLCTIIIKKMRIIKNNNNWSSSDSKVSQFTYR